MKLNTEFATFNNNIVLTDEEDDKLKNTYQTLKENLKEYEKNSDFKDLIIGDFVQGSYQRKTCLKQQEGKLPDIDVIIVTKMDEGEFDPAKLAQDKFIPFVKKYYDGQYQQQGRSIGVTLEEEGVDLDIVITSDPKEAETGFLNEELFKSMGNSKDWDFDTLEKSMPGIAKMAHLSKSDSILNEDVQLSEVGNVDPLRIPDKDANEWQNTNPMAQIFWAMKKNRICNYKYLPVVRATKWLRKSFSNFPKYPKGYPLEHIIGDNCPNTFSSVADGVVLTLKNILDNYKSHYDSNTVPYLKDRGVDENVLSRQLPEDFKKFYERISDAYNIAIEALESTDAHESSLLWRKLLGEEFPLIEPSGDDGWKKPSSAASTEKPRRFA